MGQSPPYKLQNSFPRRWVWLHNQVLIAEVLDSFNIVINPLMPVIMFVKWQYSYLTFSNVLYKCHKYPNWVANSQVNAKVTQIKDLHLQMQCNVMKAYPTYTQLNLKMMMTKGTFILALLGIGRRCATSFAQVETFLCADVSQCATMRVWMHLEA